MSSKTLWIDRGVTIVLGLMIALDGVLFIYVKAAVERVSRDVTPYYRAAGEQGMVQPPEGFTSSGDKVELAGQRQLGWAVRYAAKNCQYCRKDDSLWIPLGRQLMQLGYQVIVIAPSTQDEYPDNTQPPPGALQESLVNMDWAKQFRLTVTPTLLIFDRTQGLIWAHTGMLQPADPQSVIKEIERSRNHGN